MIRYLDDREQIECAQRALDHKADFESYAEAFQLVLAVFFLHFRNSSRSMVFHSELLSTLFVDNIVIKFRESLAFSKGGAG